MPSYRRSRIEGGMYFLTAVTHGRMPIFGRAWTRGAFGESLVEVRKRHPFDLRAIVLLPDHLHMLWALPSGDADYSMRMSLVKRRFTHSYLARGGKEGPTTPSRRKHRVRGVWEKRFFERTIRDYQDYKRHLDYIHSNPVKHGLVDAVRDWEYSSFHRYVRLGEYDLDWSGRVELPGGVDMEPAAW